jgi:hypothetical protein
LVAASFRCKRRRAFLTTLGPAHRTAGLLALAQAAYDERELPSGHLDQARLAVLADALEEAGCGDARSESAVPWPERPLHFLHLPQARVPDMRILRRKVPVLFPPSGGVAGGQGQQVGCFGVID